MSFMKNFDYLKIQMKDIVSATNNFDPTKVVGCGGFGSVYKGELSSPKGQITVAFKKLDRRLGQGNIEFWKEVMMLSKYKHENLVSLVHFCIEGDDMILVYEYASRGSLDRYLADANTLSWIQRLKICVGAARGLRFLHDPKGTQQRALHRDVKSANILLDEKWTAKVSDFGLSKFGPANQVHSYLFSHGVGTPGLCYEYHNPELTKVLVPKWRRCYDEKRLDEIILPSLKEQIHPGSLKPFSAIAYRCVNKAREERPTTAEIVVELEFSLKQEIYENTPESSHRERTSLMLSDQVDQSLDNAYSDQPPPDSEGDDSYNLGDGPGIDSFQIIGDAKPGSKLQGCGFAVRGTSTCMFQWVRHFEDGTREYIEGATVPEYLVTADDVDKLIAVECTPMGDQGQQGEIVRLFANEHNKITCDPEMQQEIDSYMSAGRALFSASLLMDSSETGRWGQTTISLRRSKYQIKICRTKDIFIHTKYSSLSIKIPLGRATQCVLTCPDGSSHTFSFHDARLLSHQENTSTQDGGGGDKDVEVDMWAYKVRPNKK
ncbi:putative receptor-like protein kinase At2g23200 [Bidens hawaiensis]|uniref:putative receptor-like protein kinase At2g23200 n=1 Tax=Bidens hawaiensis TaxID=980011 RepID=UPI004049931D